MVRHHSSCDDCDDSGAEEVAYVNTHSSSPAVEVDLGGVRVTWNQSEQC